MLARITHIDILHGEAFFEGRDIRIIRGKPKTVYVVRIVLDAENIPPFFVEVKYKDFNLLHMRI